MSHSKLISRASVTAILAVLASPAYGQATQSNDEEEVFLEEVIVTALRRNQTFQDVPAAVSVFDAATIERAGITRADDFVALIPNAALINTNTEGEAFLVLRGMAPARNAETSTAIVIDGVLATGPNELNQEFFDIQSIEVLKGPQGALYGRNAVGGAVVIRTAEPTNEVDGDVRIGFGEEGRVLAQGSASLPLIDDKLFARISVQHHQRGGKLENIFTGEERDRFRRQNFRGRLIYRASDNLDIDFRAYGGLVRDTGGIGAVADIRPEGLDVNARLPDFQNNIPSFNDQDRYGFALKIDYQFDGAELTSTSAYNFTEDRYGQDNFPYLFGDTAAEGGDGLTQYVLFNYETLSQELRLSSTTDGPFSYIAGVYAARIYNDRLTNLATDTDGILLDGRQPNLGDVNTTFAFRDDETRRTNLAAFLNLSYDVTEKLSVTAAVRYDDEEATVEDLAPEPFTTTPGAEREGSYSAWQPKFSANYAFTDDFSVYANWGRSFKAGGFNPTGAGDLVREFNPASTVVDEYGEETSSSFDAGFKARMMDGKLQLNGAGFYTRGKNFQVFEFFPGPSLQAIAQVERVRIQGFEVEATLRPTDNLMLSANYGYTDATIRELASDPSLEGNRTPYVPKDTFVATGQYEFPVNDDYSVVTRVDYNRIGKTVFNIANTPGTERDPVNLVNLRVALETDQWTLAFWAKNLFGEFYQSEPVILFPTVAATFRGAPSYWGADFSYRF